MPHITTALASWYSKAAMAGIWSWPDTTRQKAALAGYHVDHATRSKSPAYAALVRSFGPEEAEEAVRLERSRRGAKSRRASKEG